MSDENTDAPGGLDGFLRGSGLARLVGVGPVPHRVFGFAGAAGRFADARFAVRALSADERMRALGDAVKWLTGKGGWDRADLLGELGEACLNLESKVRALAVALVVPDDPNTQLAGVDGEGKWDRARAADEVRVMFEADEIERLFEELADYTDERSPLSRARTWAEVEGLIAALGKGSTAPTSLNSYDSSSLRYMLRELAVRHATLTRASYSATSPTDGSATASTTSTATP